MHLHNALAQVTLSLGGLTIAGFSMSGLATYVQVPELDVCFDMGECPLSSLSINHVLLTHAHGDHARCLPRHHQLRRMLGNASPATYFLPESIRPACEGWIRAEAAFEGVSEEELVLPPLRGLVPDGEPAPLPRRRDLAVRAFPVIHRVPSLGYTILQKKRKLRAQYRHLPGPDIARLRKEGVELSDEVMEPALTFIGDCVGQSLVEQAHIWDSRIVIIEATFLAPGEEALAAQKGHTHIAEVARALERFGAEMRAEFVVLKHFSMKYSRSDIEALVAAAIPPAMRDRVHLFL